MLSARSGVRSRSGDHGSLLEVLLDHRAPAFKGRPRSEVPMRESEDCRGATPACSSQEAIQPRICQVAPVLWEGMIVAVHEVGKGVLLSIQFVHLVEQDADLG